MESPAQTEDPILRLLEKDLENCIKNFQNSHGVIVSYVKFEILRQQTEDDVRYAVNFDAGVDIIV